MLLVCVTSAWGVDIKSPKKNTEMWTRTRFSETVALGPNCDIIGSGAPTKNCFITTHRFMEEGERFSFIGGMFIPVVEDSTREREGTWYCVKYCCYLLFSDVFPEKWHSWSHTVCISTLVTSGSTDLFSDKFDEWLEVSRTVRTDKFH